MASFPLIVNCYWLIVGAIIAPTLANTPVTFNQLFVVEFRAIDFNWTQNDQITYKLMYEDYPDLPQSFNFIDTGHGNAYLYGVLNNTLVQYRSDYRFDLIAINWHRNDVRRRSIILEPVHKTGYEDDDDADDDGTEDLFGSSQTGYEIYLKIDNLDVVSVLDPVRLTEIKQVFAALWHLDGNSSSLVVTYFEPAANLGARVPLDPNDGHGIVMKLASNRPFSQQMLDLEQEVKPLWKLAACPRNYKRTSVEIQFRRHNLMLDWCKFRLIKNERLPSKYSSVEYTSVNPVRKHGFLDANKLPTKSYFGSFAKTAVYLLVVFVTIVYLLHFIMFRDHQRPANSKKIDIFRNIYLARTVSEKPFELSQQDKEEIYATLKSNTDTLYSVSRPNTLTRRCIY